MINRPKYDEISRPISLVTATTVASSYFELNAIGTLIYAMMIPDGDIAKAADFYARLRLRYERTGTSVILCEGYISTARTGVGQGIQGSHNLPISMRTRIYHDTLNASGETQRVDIKLVIKR